MSSIRPPHPKRIPGPETIQARSFIDEIERYLNDPNKKRLAEFQREIGLSIEDVFFDYINNLGELQISQELQVIFEYERKCRVIEALGVDIDTK